MNYTVKSIIEKTTSTGKTMYNTTLADDKGAEETINLFDPVKEGDVLEGEIYTNDKGYRNFRSTKKAAASNFMNNKKTEQIEKAQERKEKSIFAAQDRSSWMWARTSAATLVANNNNYKNMDTGQLIETISDLATEIYNMEPTRPF